MENERLIQMVTFDGRTLAKLTMDELNALIQINEELIGIDFDEFKEELTEGKQEQLKEQFLNLYNPDEYDQIDEYLKCCDIDINTVTSLYNKLKKATTKQIMDIRQTLYEAYHFTYMFRFDKHVADVKLNHKSYLSC